MQGRYDKTVMPQSDKALPGRDQAMAVPESHYVNGHSLKGPFAENLRHHGLVVSALHGCYNLQNTRCK